MEIGQQFSLLTVTGFEKNRFNQKVARCQCDCGRTAKVAATRLTTGWTKSCGCLRNRTKRVMGSGESVLARLFTTYRGCAKQKGQPFELTLESFRNLILRPCFYCAEPPDHVHRITLKSGQSDCLIHHGLDRVDCSAGYTETNVVPCCKTCNYAKGDLTLEEFLAWALQDYRSIPAQSLSKEVLTNFYGTCKYQARRRGIPFLLTKAIVEKLLTSDCYYCGTSPQHAWKAYSASFKHKFISSPINGIDRVDNAREYEVANVVPCCQTCNYAKRGMPVEEFRAWLAKLRTNLRLEAAKISANCSEIKASVSACNGESYY